MKVGMIFGTRPEAIKMAPLYHKLKDRGVDAKVIATAQHREMLDQVLSLFTVKSDYDLNVMKHRQSLAGLTARLCDAIDNVFKQEQFDWILTQGDTTSTFVGSLIAFYHKIPVGHVEAGLRSFNRLDPFPEELNRRMASQLATLHFAPTQKAKENLLKDNMDEKRIVITGNTVIDALLWIINKKSEELDEIVKKYGLTDQKYILMTMHRRENHGNRMANTMRGIKKLIKKYKDYQLIFPVHYNPAVRDVVEKELKGIEHIILTDPVEYLDFVALMRDCKFIISDSGGVQEEAPSLGKPVLVLRETTERPEAIQSGVAKLIGTDADSVFENASLLIDNCPVYQSMSVASNPFGQGDASEKIADSLLRCQ
ncbi:MAG: UDP-N-acetylglucosamine 2-epimerase (non-hydrolyzing) [Thermotogota bacterium]|nr:UDP-N-acetylglucosamine 2-epimerase (non-hydrolyzing) [Thermotogota bacterium]